MAYYKISIEGVCVRNLNKDRKKINKYKIKNRYIDIKKALHDKKFNCVFVFLPWNVIEKKILEIIKLTKKPIFVEYLILSILGPWDHRHVLGGAIWSRTQ